MTTARTGKIARLPLVIRNEVNRRLDDGEPGPRIIAWLHTLPEVLSVLDEYFGEEPISAQNLSEWRQGGYKEWRERREQLDRTKGLADYSLALAERSGGSTTEGATAIAGGQLLMIFESLDVEAQKKLLSKKPGTYLGLVDALARLQKSQADAKKARMSERTIEQNERRLAQNDRKLALEEIKVQRATAEMFLKFYSDRKAAEIAEGKAKPAVKVEQLRLHMFGPVEEASNG
ncbi:hypothetical protein [Geminisphaera colitermitum]|uniref:hypothetical protein n=1 Tax=Geminisphaera colitermitum TaxID=1148786 RepID=UPI000158CA8C|nr:hypothetical protein [Geminisphaera colitermitum]